MRVATRGVPCLFTAHATIRLSRTHSIDVRSALAAGPQSERNRRRDKRRSCTPPWFSMGKSSGWKSRRLHESGSARRAKFIHGTAHPPLRPGAPYRAAKTESRLDACVENATLGPPVFGPHRLSVRTGDSQSSKRGSIPRGGTTFIGRIKKGNRGEKGLAKVLHGRGCRANKTGAVFSRDSSQCRPGGPTDWPDEILLKMTRHGRHRHARPQRANSRKTELRRTNSPLWQSARARFCARLALIFSAASTAVPASSYGRAPPIFVPPFGSTRSEDTRHSLVR